MEVVSTFLDLRRRNRTRYGLILAAALVLALAGAWWSADRARAQEGWEILSITTDYVIERNGSVEVTEQIEVDFRDLPSRGIFRDLIRESPCGEPDPAAPRTFPCPEDHVRQWDYAIHEIRYADGSPVPWETEADGRIYRVRIGDPDITLTGRQAYLLTYRVDGALDAYAQTDEFFWNAISEWPVRIRDAEFTVHLPGSTPAAAACYQGFPGGEQTCPSEIDSSDDAVTVHFRSLGMVEPFEEVNIAVAWDDKELVEVGPPITSRPFSIHDLYTLDFIEWAGMAVVAALGLVGLGRTWWRFGRDRRYTTIHYLTEDATEETRPLFQRHPVVVEYTPPMDLRPAQMGVVQDERADTVDVSATIVDLAVRGFLRIEEIPKEGWFGSADWRLHRLEKDTGELLPYESHLLTALFEGKGDEVKISDLKEKFADRLKKVQDLLYDDALQRGWFPAKPTTVAAIWTGVAMGVILVGVLLTLGAGYFLGRFLIGVPIVVVGLLLLFFSGQMSRRTADGSEAHRRVKGFRLYIDTAEKHLHEFHEEENIFAEYLPYAIVFGSVDKWAKAFESLDSLERNARSSVAPWYVGATAFNMRRFNESMSGFSGNVSSSLASRPSSGGSGIGGGGGRGGGGGGGGRW